MNLMLVLLFCGLSAVLVCELFSGRRIRFRTLKLGPAVKAEADRLEELRILHLSDIHASGSTDRRLAAVEAMSEKEWDFVFITGDLIEDDSGIEPVAEALGKLKAKYGKFAVLGNHDYFSFQPQNIVQWFKVVLGDMIGSRDITCRVPNDLDRLLDSLEFVGVRVLRNEVEQVVTDRGCLCQIFGMDDPTTDRDNPAALYESKNEEALRLVLMHSPERMESVRPIDPKVVMCGHTHGGQIRIPFFGALFTSSDAPRKAASGLIYLGGCRVHISSGMGAGQVFPYRINSPPEITELLISQAVAAPDRSDGCQ